MRHHDTAHPRHSPPLAKIDLEFVVLCVTDPGKKGKVSDTFLRATPSTPTQQSTPHHQHTPLDPYPHHVLSPPLSSPGYKKMSGAVCLIFLLVVQAEHDRRQQLQQQGDCCLPGTAVADASCWLPHLPLSPGDVAVQAAVDCGAPTVIVPVLADNKPWLFNQSVLLRIHNQTVHLHGALIFGSILHRGSRLLIRVLHIILP